MKLIEVPLSLAKNKITVSPHFTSALLQDYCFKGAANESEPPVARLLP
ncbi:MAG: hypothetical protein H7A25_20215 [Leptospiraceae bacterium]|nr:hypothetical protein [Leptospiraceae bacterium]MCP5502234.1 hypothetical protein [Leptospiraceae bacterium]